MLFNPLDLRTPEELDELVASERRAFRIRLVAVLGLLTGVLVGVFLFSVLPNKDAIARRVAELRTQINLALSGPAVAPPLAAAELHSVVLEASRIYRLESEMLWAMIAVESRFQQFALSHRGARGFMQLMPSTARSVGVLDVHSPKENIFGGARYFRRMLDRYNNSYPLALAAYNAGPGAVDKYKGIPPFKETKDYVKKVMAAYEAEKAKRFQLLK